MTVGESEEAQARADSTMGDEENWRVGDAQAAREIEVLQVLQLGEFWQAQRTPPANWTPSSVVT